MPDWLAAWLSLGSAVVIGSLLLAVTVWLTLDDDDPQDTTACGTERRDAA